MLEVLVASVVVAGDRLRTLVRRVELIALDMVNGGSRCDRDITEEEKSNDSTSDLRWV